MAVNKVVQSNGTTLIDITPTTAVESDVASGAVALDDDMRQALKAEVLETKQQEHYDQLVEDAVAALNPSTPTAR